MFSSRWYMNMRIKIFCHYSLAVFVLLFGGAPQADIFKWTDASGHTYYGDERPPGAFGVEVVDIEDCRTPACIEEQERRRQDAVEANRRIEDWLDRTAAQREQIKDRWHSTTVYVHTYQPPQWSLLPYTQQTAGARVLRHRPHPAVRGRHHRMDGLRGGMYGNTHRYVARPRSNPIGTALRR